MPRRRRHRRPSPLRWLLPLLLFAVLLGAGGMCYRHYRQELPYLNAKNYMPEEPELTVWQQYGGSLHLSWLPAEKADCYCVEILRPGVDGAEPQPIFRGYTEDPSAYPLPGIPSGTELILKVSSVVEYGEGEVPEQRFCENPAVATLTFDAPAVKDLMWRADPETGAVDVSCALQNATHCRVWLAVEGQEPVLVKTVTETDFRLTFGEDGDLPALQRGQRHTLLLDACLMTEDIAFYGIQSGSFSVTQQNLLGRDLAPVLTDEGNNVCTITWKETKGDWYAVQQLGPDGRWFNVAEIPGDGELRYSSGHLENLSCYRFRVMAVGGDTLPGVNYAALSEEMEFETGIIPVFCTVWPVKDMDAYDAPEGNTVAGRVTQAKAYCVTDVAGDMLGIQLQGKTCYIDGNYCMINLPEYLGELCAYDITNSYSSIYMVHEYALPEITDTVIDGYGSVAQVDGSYLVPLLYPTAQKLLAAAQDAISRGYRLKIYDAFRPNRATQQIYDLAEALLDQPIPNAPFKGAVPPDMPVTAPGEIITYRRLMTAGGWDLSNFLAKGRSMHNLGIAVDITLEKADTGTELKMQTSIHDLSSYSVLTRNNEYAEELAEIMKNAGMAELISEWWHFQDNEIKKTLELPSIWQGVSAECWMWDDQGCRFRNRDGSFIRNTTMTIGGESWRFDSEGYAHPAE